MATSIRQLRNIFNLPSQVIILQDHEILRPNNNSLVRQNTESFQMDNSDNSDVPLDYTSSLGTPVYTNIEFLPGQYETNTKGVFNKFGSDQDGPDRLRFETVLISVTQQKLIVRTQIAGRNGSVKEYIGEDDYMVQIAGIITGNNGQRPLDKILAFKKMLNAPIAIQVASQYLQSLGIEWLVIDSYDLSEEEGGYSYQKFTLNCYSDIQQELELVNV